MYGAIKLARVNDKFQDPLYLFLELVRAGVMHGHLWSQRAFSGGPSFGTGKHTLHYISFVLSFEEHIFLFLVVIFLCLQKSFYTRFSTFPCN